MDGQCQFPKEFFSVQLWIVLRSSIIGLLALIINQDILENIFGQVRGTNGQNNNNNNNN